MFVDKASIQLKICALHLKLPVSPGAAVEVKVGGYPFAPYVSHLGKGKYSGLSLDLMAELNRLQTKYKFIFVSISNKNRYQPFARHRFDVMFFEDTAWDWQDYDIAASKLPIIDGEVYIALNKPGRWQSYFASFANKTLVLVQGYHYAFANMESDPAILKQSYKLQFVKSNQASIYTFAKERGDIAPATSSYLKTYLETYPEFKSKLLISKKWDQHYVLSVLARESAPPSIKKINTYLRQLEDDDTLDRLKRRYGLADD